MGKINLQREGTRTTDHAAPVTNSHSDLRMQGISAMQRASNSLANGIAYVGQAIGDIAKDQLQMQNEIAVNGAQIELLKAEQAFNDGFEKRITAGEFKDFDSFQKAYIEEYSSIIESPLNQKFQDDGMSDAARHALAVHIKRSQATNFARLGGAWKRITTDNMIKGVYNQAEELAKMGGTAEAFSALFKPYAEVGWISRETAEKSTAEYARKAALLGLDKELSAISDIENNAEAMAKIKKRVETFKEALEGKISDEGLKFLYPSDIVKAKDAYSKLYAKLYGNEAAALKEKRDASFAYRLNKLWEADDASLADREKNLYRFVNENPAFNAEEKVEARLKIGQTLATIRDKRQKLAAAQVKEAVKESNNRTDFFISQTLKGENVEYSQGEANNIAQIQAAAKEVFAAPDKDQSGKIIKTAAEKQEAYKWKLEDAVKSYNPKRDEDGSFARALYYQIEGVFDDSISEDFVRVPSKEEIEWQKMDEAGQCKFLERRHMGKFTPNTDEHLKAANTILSGKFDYAAARKEYLSEIGANANRKEYSPLIHDPELKRRLLRELGQRRGVYPDSKIEISQVRRLLNPMIETVLKKSQNQLKAHQNSALEAIKMGFENAAMTAGLDSPQELENWFRTSPYVATFKERLKLLKKLGEDEEFDTSFSHVGATIKNAPKLYPQGGNIFEEMYLKLKQNQNSEE